MRTMRHRRQQQPQPPGRHREEAARAEAAEPGMHCPSFLDTLITWMRLVALCSMGGRSILRVFRLHGTDPVRSFQARQPLPVGDLPRHHGRRHHRHLGGRLHLAPPLRPQEGQTVRPRHQPRASHRVWPSRAQPQQRWVNTRAGPGHVRPRPDQLRRRVRREATQEEEVDSRKPDLDESTGRPRTSEAQNTYTPYISRPLLIA